MEENSPPQLNSLEVEAELASGSDFALINDIELCDLVRTGSSDAFAELFSRYRYPALRLARYYSRDVDSDDVVAEVFAQVLGQLQRGKGPHSAVRAYIFTAVRREMWKRVRALKRVSPTDNLELIDQPVPFAGSGLDMSERDRVRAAYQSLPKRWRNVLWYLEVEGRKPRELAAVLGLKPNGVSALLYRARVGLRKAYEAQDAGNGAVGPVTEVSESTEPSFTISSPRGRPNLVRLEDARTSR